MRNVFITNIHIKKVRHLENVDIKLSETERKHLIFTGKNGSGKTSVLEAMNKAIPAIRNGSAPIINQKQVVISFSIEAQLFKELAVVYIPANHLLQVKQPTTLTPGKNENFWQTMVNYDYQMLGAVQDNDEAKINRYKEWFERIDDELRNIYDCSDLTRKIDRAKFDVKIQMPGREPFSLNQMSDGYSALFDIVTKLLLQMDKGDGAVDFSGSGIVLIDEIETHLHVELQKRVLPFLTKMFPNVQFIVTTHSPFVITSIENAVVYDLETQRSIDDATIYSYDDIIKGFYDLDETSEQAKADFERYKVLCEKDCTPEEETERKALQKKMLHVPGSSIDLYLDFRNYERERRSNGKN
jgi:predicted ATP-binding protein involved in virulence